MMFTCKNCNQPIQEGLEAYVYTTDNEAWHVKCEGYLEPIVFEDEVNKPSHYHKGGIDVIGFAELHYSKEELKGFYRINMLKYIDRYDKKGGIKDLKKSEFYLHKLIELEEKHA